MRKSICKLNLILVSTLFSTLVLFPIFSQAANITTFRIYLDNEKNSDNFIIFSKDVMPEDCSLKLKHFIFDKTGNMTEGKPSELPDNAAADWVRYTPRSFELKPLSSQTVRFSMRRKANSTPAEYRSYLSIECVKQEMSGPIVNNTPDTASFSVKPKLIQNVPIIVRTGKLSANASIDNIKIHNNQISFHLNRNGNRSLYGRIALVDLDSGDELNFIGGVSVYTETDYIKQSFPIPSGKLSNLAIRFVEDETYGGSITVEKKIN